MKTYILTCLFFLTFYTALLSQSGVKHTESYYQSKIQKILGGETEVSVTSGRVDLVTDTHAYEIERASKWKHSIGQALWYGLQSNKKPGIILLILDKSEYKYFIQLNSALNYGSLNNKIDVRAYPRDF